MIKARVLWVLLALVLPVSGSWASGRQEAPAEGRPYAGSVLRVAAFDGPSGNKSQDLVADFETKTGAKVQIERVPWAGMHEKYVTALVGGGYVYDVMYQVYRTELELADYYVDLDPYISRDPSVMDDIVAVCLKYGVNPAGRRHAVPAYFAVNAVNYRTDLFSQAGIAPNPRWGFEEFLAVAKKLETPEAKGVVLSGITEQLLKPLASRYWGMGGHLFTPDWKPLPQREAMINALRHLKATFDLAPSGAPAYPIPDAVNMFAQGRAAMLEEWQSFAWPVLEDVERSRVKGKWSVLPVPGGASQIAGPWGWAITANARHQDLAWEWIKHEVSVDAQRMGLLRHGVMPARAGVYRDPETLKAMPWMNDYLAAAEGGRPLPRIKTSHVMIEALNVRAGAVIAGRLTPEQALREILPIWEEQVKLGEPASPYTEDYMD